MENENSAEAKQESKKKPKRFPNKNYAVKKRLPIRPIDGDNVIFITKKTTFKAQLDKCCDLLTKGEKEIILHGLGAAIQRCCNLALHLQVLFAGTCQIEVNTGTVDVVDDLEPLTDDLDFGAQVRHSSSIHIRIFRNAVLGANQ
ncbi:ribonuclease P protein subunit p20-like isoform X1 [Pectinophora gossypiella]|uniref:ribonuclease P protein subunit p20-like isoform X1 n=1 Tax=Pectinophora gossypiella TaxID=13191 RepID=UPI00214E2BBF|nr:ribonuclease P protein subunit p20-like isoform X1 [Pectinophora gossypiella]